MNHIQKEIESIKKEFPEDEASYWGYLLAFRIFHAVNPRIDPDTITDYKEFSALLDAVQEAKDIV